MEATHSAQVDKIGQSAYSRITFGRCSVEKQGRAMENSGIKMGNMT